LALDYIHLNPVNAVMLIYRSIGVIQVPGFMPGRMESGLVLAHRSAVGLHYHAARGNDEKSAKPFDSVIHLA